MSTLRYPLYLTMAQELAVKLERRSDVDSIALALDMRSYEDTFLEWLRHKPENSGVIIGRFFTVARQAQEHLTRVPSAPPTSFSAG